MSRVDQLACTGRGQHLVLGTGFTSLVYDSRMSCIMLMHDLLFMIYVSVIAFAFWAQLVHDTRLYINYSFYCIVVAHVCSSICSLHCHNLYSCMSYIASLTMHILLLSYLHEFVIMDCLLAMTMTVGM